jgi:hypothetical protein
MLSYTGTVLAGKGRGQHQLEEVCGAQQHDGTHDFPFTEYQGVKMHQLQWVQGVPSACTSDHP